MRQNSKCTKVVTKNTKELQNFAVCTVFFRQDTKNSATQKIERKKKTNKRSKPANHTHVANVTLSTEESIPTLKTLNLYIFKLMSNYMTVNMQQIHLLHFRT